MMEQLTPVRSLFEDTKSFDGKTVKVGGWVRNLRASKNFGFINLSDGTYFSQVQVVFGAELVGRIRQIEADLLAGLELEGGRGDRHPVDAAGTGRDGTLHGRPGKLWQQAAQGLVQPLPHQSARHAEIQMTRAFPAHQRPPRTVMLFTRSPKVVVRYRLRSSLPGVMELTTARPMTKRSLSLAPSTVRTPQTLWKMAGRPL